jgi:hypothetical protein
MPSWLSSKQKLLDDMLQLPQGWDSYGANPINPKAVKKAKELLDSLPLWAWQCVPVATGGVQIELHEKGFDIEISIEASK